MVSRCATQMSGFELNAAGYFDELSTQLDRQRRQLEAMARRSQRVVVACEPTQAALVNASVLPADMSPTAPRAPTLHVRDGLLKGRRLLGDEGAGSPMPRQHAAGGGSHSSSGNGAGGGAGVSRGSAADNAGGSGIASPARHRTAPASRAGAGAASDEWLTHGAGRRSPRGGLPKSRSGAHRLPRSSPRGPRHVPRALLRSQQTFEAMRARIEHEAHVAIE